MENVEFIFGFDAAQVKSTVGSTIQYDDQNKCQRIRLAKGDCVSSMTIGGTHTAQRIVMNTKNNL